MLPSLTRLTELSILASKRYKWNFMCQLLKPFLKIRGMYICVCKFINMFRILIKDGSYKACCAWSRLYYPDCVNKIPLDRTNRSMSFFKHILSLGLRPGQKQDAVTYLLTRAHVTDRAMRPNSSTSSVPLRHVCVCLFHDYGKTLWPIFRIFRMHIPISRPSKFVIRIFTFSTFNPFID